MIIRINLFFIFLLSSFFSNLAHASDSEGEEIFFDCEDGSDDEFFDCEDSDDEFYKRSSLITPPKFFNTDQFTISLSCNQSLNSFLEDEAYLEVFANLSTYMGRTIRYSLSGSNAKVDRQVVGKYEGVSTPYLNEQFRNLKALLKNFYFLDAFKLMMQEKMGDCCEQSLFLAFALKNIKKIDEKYLILMADIEGVKSSVDNHKERLDHVFLVLIERRKVADFEAHRENLPGNFFYQDSIILLDPWLNRIFTQDNLRDDDTPVSWVTGASLRNGVYCVQNLDKCYINAQVAFRGYRTQLASELEKTIFQLKLVKRPKNLLSAPLKNGDFGLTLRRAATDRNCASIVKFIVDKALFLSVNVNARGASSGTALDIARSQNNQAAIEILQPFAKCGAYPAQ